MLLLFRLSLGLAVDLVSVDLEGWDILLLLILLAGLFALDFFVFLVVGAIVGEAIVAEEAVGDADNVKQPKQVQGLQGGQQRGGDVLADPALVLLGDPVELKGADGAELGEEGDEDLDVDDVAEVDPDADEAEKVRCDEEVVEVVEDLGRGQEEVGDVVGGVDGDANVGKVEAVAEADEGQADNVVADELLVVLARLLHAQDEDEGLLGPVGGLEEVVELDDGLVGLVGEVLVHAAGVEVPNGRAAHDVQAGRAEKEEVDGRVRLLHEASLLGAAQAGASRKGPQELLHDKLAGKGEHNGVECDKGNVPFALAIVDELLGVRLRQRVREEDEVVQNVGRGRVEGVPGQEEEDNDGREDKGAADEQLSHARDDAAGATALGALLGRNGCGGGGVAEIRGRRGRGRCYGGVGLRKGRRRLLSADWARDETKVQQDG